jgi:hypothetical protein
MASIKAYKAGLVALSVVATVFAILWFTTYINYKLLEDKYTNLKVTHRYILKSIGSASVYDKFPPGSCDIVPIFIPNSFVGVVQITVNSSPSSVGVYVYNLYDIARSWCINDPFVSVYLSDEGTHHDHQIILNPGVYAVVITNPHSTLTSVSYRIKTTYIPESVWLISSVLRRPLTEIIEESRKTYEWLNE